MGPERETTEAAVIWRQPWSLGCLAAMLSLWMVVGIAGPFAAATLPFLLGPLVDVVVLIAIFATPPLFVLGLGGIVLQAGLGIISRWWLFVPALWLSGYYYAWNESNRAAQSLAQEIAAEHATLPLSFSPTDSDVQIEIRSVPGNVQALSQLANKLVYRGFLRIAYENSQNRGASDVSDRVYHAVSGSDCDRLKELFVSGSGDIQVLGASPRCVYLMPGEPNRPVFRVTPAQRSLSRFLNGGVHDLRVVDPTGRTVVVSKSYVSKLSAIPILWFSCGLFQGCRPLLRYTPISIPGPGPLDWEEQAVALALGLKDRWAAGYTPYAELYGRIEDMSQQALLRLNQWLANPEAILGETDIALLRRRAEWLTPHAEALAHRYERFSVEGAPSSNAIWQLVRLLLALNDADLVRVADRLRGARWYDQQTFHIGVIMTLNDRVCALFGPLACEYVWPKALR